MEKWYDQLLDDKSMVIIAVVVLGLASMWKLEAADHRATGSLEGFCYCLSAPAGPIAVYSEGNTSLSLQTDSASVGEVLRYDPRGGSYKTLPAIVAGGRLRLEVPDEQDWVFLVKPVG